MTGPEVIKLEFILKLKIKRNDWLLVDTSSLQCYSVLSTIAQVSGKMSLEILAS